MRNLTNKIKIVKLFAGFSIIGFFVTMLTLGLIYFFLEILQTPLIISYVGIYIFGIIISFYLNANYVYKAPQNKKKLFYYFIIYLSSLLIGALILWILSHTLTFENWILGYMVVPFTMIWNFTFATKLFKFAE
jgi:putative flippase GtrA